LRGVKGSDACLLLQRDTPSSGKRLFNVQDMSSLSGKSDEEISQLLDEYGIKHGPILESTRNLYKKKLSEAMTKNAKPSSSNKTYYREERKRRKWNILPISPPIISPARSSYQSSSRPGPSDSTSMQRGQSSPETSKSGGVPGWLRVLVFLIIAVFLYYVYTCMEPAEEIPLKSIQ
ncbi:hypothetical protein cypCar_00003513, partial [Cyprinus carpio]